MNRNRLWLALALLLWATGAVHGRVVGRGIVYQDQETELRGVLYWDNRTKDRRPAVLVFPSRWGLTREVRRRARALAMEGYVTFAADLYGDGAVTRKAERATLWVRRLTKNPLQWVQRGIAALDQLHGVPQADPERIAAIGFGLGGDTALQMAYAGLRLRGVVNFHGRFPAPPGGREAQRGAELLLFRGEEDGRTPTGETLARLKARLDAARLPWKMVSYPGVFGGFTDPRADGRGPEGDRYDAAADKDAWRRTKKFLSRVLAGQR